MNIEKILEKIHNSFIAYLREMGEDVDTIFHRVAAGNQTSGDGYEHSIISLSTSERTDYDGRIRGQLKISPRDSSEPPVFKYLFFVVNSDESEIFLVYNQTTITPIDMAWDNEINDLIGKLKEKHSSFERVTNEYADVIGDFEVQEWDFEKIEFRE